MVVSLFYKSYSGKIASGQTQIYMTQIQCIYSCIGYITACDPFSFKNAIFDETSQERSLGDPLPTYLKW